MYTTTKRALLVLAAVLLFSSCWNMLNPLDPASANHTGSVSMRIRSLELTPAEIDGLDDGPIEFRLKATFEDGSRRDVTESSTWRSTNPTAVTVSNLAGSSGMAQVTGGGEATVFAEYLGVDSRRFNAQASLTVEAIHVAVDGNNSNDGSREAPFRTIEPALNAAASVRLVAVLVAAGDYVLSEPLEIDKDVVLLGGFDRATWVRNPELHETVVRSNASSGGTYESPNAAIEISGANVTRDTIIDGFSVRGGGGNNSAGIMVTENAAPTIRGNRIHGGTASFSLGGVLARDASPLIVNNDVFGGGTHWGVGIWSIDINDASDTRAAIVGNRIHGGTGREFSRGISANNSFVTVVNNLIDAGDGWDDTDNDPAIGINMTNSADGYLWSNTIVVAPSVEERAGFAIAMRGATADIVNNLILYPGGSELDVAIAERRPQSSEPQSSSPSRVRNNNIWGQNLATLYRRWVSADDYQHRTTIDQLNDPALTTGPDANSARDNVSVDPALVDPGRLTPNDPGGYNWRLSSQSPAAVTGGGYSFSAAPAFPPDARDAQGRPIDADGRARQSPWSIGAYQRP